MKREWNLPIHHAHSQLPIYKMSMVYFAYQTFIKKLNQVVLGRKFFVKPLRGQESQTKEMPLHLHFWWENLILEWRTSIMVIAMLRIIDLKSYLLLCLWRLECVIEVSLGRKNRFLVMVSWSKECIPIIFDPFLIIHFFTRNHHVLFVVVYWGSDLWLNGCGFSKIRLWRDMWRYNTFITLD